DDHGADMLILLLIWVSIGIALARLVAQRGRDSAGLPLAYFLGLSLIHVPGALLYLDADDAGFIASATRVGFEQTIIGMAKFVVGVIFARYAHRLRPTQQRANERKDADLRNLRALNSLAVVYVCIGSVAFFVVMPLIAGIGTITAIVSSLGSLI